MIDHMYYRWNHAVSVALSTTPAASGTVPLDTLKRLRLCATAACWISIGPPGTVAALNVGTYLPALRPEIIAIAPGEIIAAVIDAASGSAATGVLNITTLNR